MCLIRCNFYEKIRFLIFKKMFCFKLFVKENVFWYFCLIFESVYWLLNIVIFCFKKKLKKKFYNWFIFVVLLYDVDNGYINEYLYMLF